MSKLCKIYNKESTQAPHHRPFMRGYHPWPVDFAHKRPMVQNTMTSSNGNIFRVIGHLCGEFTGSHRIPLTKAIDVRLWCFFDLRLNKQFSKQSWGWWFETLSRSLWGHCNEAFTYHVFRLTHISLYKMAAISQTIFLDAGSWVKRFVFWLFWLKFHWTLFLRIQLTITQHWFR